MHKCVYPCKEQCEDHHHRLSESVVALLEDNADIFSSVCDMKIGTIEDVGTGALEVHLVKTLDDSKLVRGFGSPWTNDNVPRSVLTDDGVCTTGES